MTDFSFPIDKAETVFLEVLDQRRAILTMDDFSLAEGELPNNISLDWVNNSRTAYAWATRTPLAMVLCGLLARASNPRVDPYSLQEGSGEFGYNAHGLWSSVIYKHGYGIISLNRLKEIPFNNSPFNGKRKLDLLWPNTSEKSRKPIAEAYEMLTRVSEMTSEQATTALLSFLVAAPEPPVSVSAFVFGDEDDLSKVTITLHEFCDEVRSFMLINSDGGRRAQAFVAACIDVVKPGQTHTPASVNDPSRSSPGDVKTFTESNGKKIYGPFFVEVKDKIVRRENVVGYLASVKLFSGQASAGYAAFANTDEVESKAATALQIPSAEQLTVSSGVPTVLWRSPLELVSQVVAWSGIPVSAAIWRCAHNYNYWLNHIDTGVNGSPAEWEKRMLKWGFLP
jgi:hypothetical protein